MINSIYQCSVHFWSGFFVTVTTCLHVTHTEIKFVKSMLVFKILFSIIQQAKWHTTWKMTKRCSVFLEYYKIISIPSPLYNREKKCCLITLLVYCKTSCTVDGLMGVTRQNVPIHMIHLLKDLPLTFKYWFFVNAEIHHKTVRFSYLNNVTSWLSIIHHK